MENTINVKENVNLNDAEVEVVTRTFKEQNKERNDEFIFSQTYSADAAYDRLKLIRRIMREWKDSINSLDRRDMPYDMIEKYEKMWSIMRDIEIDELAIVRVGE